MKSETAVGYEDIRRVRASDRPPQVTIDVTGRKRFKIANYYAFADRPLPEVEFKEGAFHEPIRRMRSITSFLAQRMATT